MLYVRGNNCDTGDAEYYVNHLMVAVLRELDGDTLLYYRSKPHHDGSVMTGCVIFFPINAPGMGRFKLFDLVGHS